MPVGNPATVPTSAYFAASLRSNSPVQIVPCSPFIGTLMCHSSPAATVPDARRITHTPDIGHLVPQTPTSLDHVDVQKSRSFSMPSKASGTQHGEQLVPQTPSSSEFTPTPTRHVETSTPQSSARRQPAAFPMYTESTSFQRNVHRKPRTLPGPEVTQQVDTTLQIDLFRGDDIFG